MKPSLPLRTNRLRLRAFASDDVDALADIHGREDVSRYLYGPPLRRSRVAEMLQKRISMTSLEKEGDRMVLAVEVADTGALVGDVLLAWISQEHRGGEIGFVFHPDHHGRGYATEAAGEMLRFGFDEFELHRIIGRCDGRNLASARLMKRLGMRQEAHFVQNEFVKGEWTDELVYAVLAEEWRQRR